MENINEKPNKFGSKKRGKSILPIVFSSVLAAGAIAGSGVSIWQVQKNYTESSEFTKSVSGRIKVNPAAGLSQEEISSQSEADAESILKDCAERLSRWLKDKGQKSYDVSYEFYPEQKAKAPGSEVEQYWGYLNAQFELDKIDRKHPTSEEEEEEKIDNDPYLTFFSEKGFNSNEKTLVYRWWVQDASSEPKYTIIPFRDLFKIPSKTGSSDEQTKVMVNEDGDNGVIYELQANNTKLNDIYLDFAKAKKYSEEKDPENKDIANWQQPRLYLVNNINGLYDEANYHLARYFEEGSDYRDIYEGTDYETFAKRYSDNNARGEERSSDQKNHYFFLDNAKDQDNKDIVFGDIFNYIDQTTPGTNEVSFSQKYVNSTIWTMNDFESVMPKEITENYKNEIDVDADKAVIKYFWYPSATKEAAQFYLNNQITYGFNKASIASFDLTGIDRSVTPGKAGAIKVLNQIRGNEDQSIIGQLRTTYIAPSFSETIFGGSNVVGALSLGFLIFLIALLVILAVLYRTTGIMSWICMFFALSITLLIATAASTAVTMSLILGLFIAATAMFLGALSICSRMRRRLLSNEDTQLMIKKTFKKSLLPLADISIITLIFGVCFTYIAPISLNALGLVLIIGGFATFISVYLLNGLLHGLFFNNRIMINRFSFFGKPSNVANEALSQGNNNIPVGLDATRLEIPFYSTMSKKKIDATNKRAMIAVIVIGVILIIGIILFSTLGYISPSMFHTSQCLAVQYDGDIFSQPWVSQLSYRSVRHDLTSGWWYFYTDANNLKELLPQIEAQASMYGFHVMLQNIFGSTNQDILNLALIAIIVATLCSAVYGAIRYNWIAFVPMLTGAFIMPLLTLGLATIFQIKFDQFVVLAFAFVVVINTIFSSMIVCSINESWSRKDAYNNKEFSFIVNVSLTNCWQLIWNFAAAYLTFILIFGLCSPATTNLGSVIGLFFIGFVVILAITPVTLAFLLYLFMKIRNVVLNKIVDKNKTKVVVNYDDIDEQEIEGINKFTRKIPIAKDSKQEGANK